MSLNTQANRPQVPLPMLLLQMMVLLFLICWLNTGCQSIQPVETAPAKRIKIDVLKIGGKKMACTDLDGMTTIENELERCDQVEGK
jgi:hypothetical protein